jgi:hypothetical protein
VVSGVFNQVPVAKGNTSVPGGYWIVLQGREEGSEQVAIKGAQLARVSVDTQDPDGLCANVVEKPGERGVSRDKVVGDLAGPGAGWVGDKGNTSG